jgi:hypothetical protein
MTEAVTIMVALRKAVAIVVFCEPSTIAVLEAAVSASVCDPRFTAVAGHLRAAPATAGHLRAAPTATHCLHTTSATSDSATVTTAMAATATTAANERYCVIGAESALKIGWRTCRLSRPPHEDRQKQAAREGGYCGHSRSHEVAPFSPCRRGRELLLGSPRRKSNGEVYTLLE